MALVFVFGGGLGPVVTPEGDNGAEGDPAGPGTPDQPPVVEDGQLIELYFVSQELMEDGTVAPGHTVVAVERTIPDDEELFAPEEAIKLLLAGPIGQEAETLTTAIPVGTKLNELIMREQTAFLDFSEELGTASGSGIISALREQIYRTATQFDDVVAVVERIDGRPIEDYLRP